MKRILLGQELSVFVRKKSSYVFEARLGVNCSEHWNHISLFTLATDKGAASTLSSAVSLPEIYNTTLYKFKVSSFVTHSSPLILLLAVTVAIDASS